MKYSVYEKCLLKDLRDKSKRRVHVCGVVLSVKTLQKFTTIQLDDSTDTAECIFFFDPSLREGQVVELMGEFELQELSGFLLRKIKVSQYRPLPKFQDEMLFYLETAAARKERREAVCEPDVQIIEEHSSDLKVRAAKGVIFQIMHKYVVGHSTEAELVISLPLVKNSIETSVLLKETQSDWQGCRPCFESALQQLVEIGYLLKPERKGRDLFWRIGCRAALLDFEDKLYLEIVRSEEGLTVNQLLERANAEVLGLGSQSQVLDFRSLMAFLQRLKNQNRIYRISRKVFPVRM